MTYDYLILATGSTHAYFGHDEWRDVAPGLKTLEDALEIRRRVLLAFERAERESDPAKRQPLLTFVVIGGGPTGVELAGALAEMSRQSLARDFRHFDPGSARIVLLEGGPSLLSELPRAAARRRAERSRAAWRRSADRVGGHGGVGRTRGDAASGSIEAATILWAAGVAASPLGATLGAATDRAGRVAVQPDLTIPGHPEVFVIGDLASVNGADGKPLPGVAQVAIQTGRHAARNIRRAIDGEPSSAVRVPEPGEHGDDRPRIRDCRLRVAAAQRLDRVARVALRPHHEPDRVPESRASCSCSGPGRISATSVPCG